MTIRLLQATDAESYWNLRLESLKENPEAFATTYEESMQQVANNLETAGSFTFGAFKNDKLIGIVTVLQEKRLKLQHRGVIVSMYVTPSQRNSGIGQALLKETLKKAKELNLEQITLTVLTDNKPAKALYESMGFQTFGIEKKALKYKEQYFDEEFMVLECP
ncbi:MULTISPECIES: GNAT family N-acetyltransferase [Bacillus cereus group]|uniref:GNAT family N-acetyltransferase n=1 Tax=Bacillus cereus TaxID=1396 RepID=A0A2A8UA41_BACCE|nr:GNAT family N-acetyltransferase [Bacillus cereus]PDY83307.1 GNAT family N-acetyltransferase [Bacillus cereus]PFA16421.1 GNAT family N-acetyltransferase [Bacillus cereus]PGL59621.1 GNAT family N-acetyltransferase [Bacillus cereus]PGQ07518.1 GNAT family N-acetyltransferase [Bacillus cereus]